MGWLVPTVVIAVGIVAFARGMRLFFGYPSRPTGPRGSGTPLSRVTPLVALCVSSAAMVWWFVCFPYMAAQKAGPGLMGVAVLAMGLFAIVLQVMLFTPLVVFTLVDSLMDALGPSGGPPEPEDPVERAVFADERGEVGVAVERCWWELKRQPDCGIVRVRLAKLLAGRGRIQRSKALIAEGLALEGTPSENKAELRALAAEIAAGSFAEVKPEAGPLRLRALEDLAPKPRLEARREAGAEDEPAIRIDDDA